VSGGNEHRHIAGCPQELFREGKNFGSGQSFKLFDGDYNEGAEKTKLPNLSTF